MIRRMRGTTYAARTIAVCGAIISIVTMNPPQGNPLQDRFSALARKMRSEFEWSELTRHLGSRGTEREEIVANFLELYIPGTAEIIHNAEIVATTDVVSGQCDIVVADKSTPRLGGIKSHRIVPAECVYGVIQVKTRLDRRELANACDNIASVKRLARDSYVRSRGALVGYRSAPYPPAPIFGYVFAFKGNSLENLMRGLIEWCSGHPREQHPDGVWILDSGMLVWGRGDGSGIWTFSIPDSRLDRELLNLGRRQQGDELLGLVMGVTSQLTQLLPPLDLSAYLSKGLLYTVNDRARL